MDYDDINAIAAQITESIDANNGLVDGLSAINIFKQPGPSTRYTEESIPESINLSSSMVRPMLNSSGMRAKSITLLETKGCRVINPRAMPKTAPKAAPKQSLLAPI